METVEKRLQEAGGKDSYCLMDEEFLFGMMKKF